MGVDVGEQERRARKMVGLLLVLIWTAILMTSSNGECIDRIVTPGARGSQVVEDVISVIRSNCILPNGGSFLRSLAYAQSQDGTVVPKNFNGGIWQINESDFKTTQNCDSPIIKTACESLSNKFTIHWPSVTWSDLSKPLYSGIAAALYTRLNCNNQNGCQENLRNITSQAHLWYTMFNKSEQEFIKAYQYILSMVSDCADKLDLIFVLESTRTVSGIFTQTSSFAVDVVRDLNVSLGRVRVGCLQYNIGVITSVPLDNFADVDSLQTKLNDLLPYQDEKKNTGQALFEAYKMLDESLDRKKVVILTTSGLLQFSHDFNNSREISDDLKKNISTTMFVIGVNTNITEELDQLASEPSCTHVFKLDDPSAVESIRYDLHSMTCGGSSQRVRPENLISGNIPDGSYKVVTTTVIGEQEESTYNVNSTCGELKIFVSTDSDITISTGRCENYYIATSSQPAVIPIPSATQVYITTVDYNHCEGNTSNSMTAGPGGSGSNSGLSTKSGGNSGLSTESGGNSGLSTKSGGNLGLSTKSGGNSGLSTKSGGNSELSTKSGGNSELGTKSGGNSELSTKSGGNSELSTGAIVGIIVGCLVALVIIGGIIFAVLYYKKNKVEPDNEDPTPDSGDFIPFVAFGDIPDGSQTSARDTRLPRK